MMGLMLRTASQYVGRCCLIGACLSVCALPTLASDLRRTPLVKAIQKARPSVVNIHSEKTLNSTDNRFGNIETSRRVNGMGTGVVLDERGYIITNQHVIDGVEKIRVTLADSEVYTAKLISSDRQTDLAIIKIDSPKEMPIITIGTSIDLMPGEPVVAVGNAYGYEHTVTRGIISALNRTVQLSETQQYVDLIQTDASINPGNSGGPLLNIDGEMVGINVAVRAGAQGIGFAIPVDNALITAAELLSAKRIAKVDHGIVISSQTPEGIVVGKLASDSVAREAGLRTGDVIAAANGRSLERQLDLERCFFDSKAGDKVQLTIYRAEETLELEYELAASETSTKGVDASELAWQMLGVRLTAAPAKQFAQQRTRYRGGLVVSEVREEGPAARQGIRDGDVLVGLHIWETVTPENVAHILSRPELAKLTPLKFYVVRSGKTLYGYLPVDLNPNAITTAANSK